MKELSIEEKAKRYDEAIKRAEEYYKEGKTLEYANDIVSDIFPELKEESEDERIRKEIIRIVDIWTNSSPVVNGIPREILLAWLEKQGEKPNTVYDKELSETLGRVICRYINEPNIPYVEREKVSREIIPYVERLEKQDNNMGISEATKQKLEDNLNKALEKETPESWNKFLDEQGEQKSVIEMKSAEESLGISSDTYNKIVDECIYGEQKPAHIDYVSGIREELLSIEDNAENINGLTESQWVAIRAAHRLLGECMDKEQKSAEWSEEDEDILNTIINHFKIDIECTDEDDIVRWLKSLKERYTWKPSDEQMGVIEAVINNRSFQRRHLDSLYTDLKKLRGE